MDILILNVQNKNIKNKKTENIQDKKTNYNK